MKSSEEMKDGVLEALDDMKAQEVVVLPVGRQSSIADYFVIASGTSETHCKSMAQEVLRRLKEEEILPLNSGEGGSAAWTLLDFGAVVVHVFSREARSRYNLEGHWKGLTPARETPEAAAPNGEAVPGASEATEES